MRPIRKKLVEPLWIKLVKVRSPIKTLLKLDYAGSHSTYSNVRPPLGRILVKGTVP